MSKKKKPTHFRSIAAWALVLLMMVQNVQPVVASMQELTPTPSASVQQGEEGDALLDAQIPPDESDGDETNVEAEVSPTPTEAIKEDKEEKKELERAPRIKVDGDDKLLVNISTPEGWSDVDTLTNNRIDWASTLAQRQVQIVADFSDLLSTKDRIIEIEIPEGYRLTEYSAKSTTPAIDGVRKLDWSSEADARVDSVSLTALDGGSWAAQKVTGYLQRVGSTGRTEDPIRTYPGKIRYVMNETCPVITITLTLEIQRELLPRTGVPAASPNCILDNLAVKMTSGAKTLSSHLSTNVLPLRVAGNEITTKTVGAAVGAAKTRTFELTSSVSATPGFLAEEGKVTIAYPEGARFLGFREGIANINGETASTGGTYANNHLKVEVDTTAKTVTFTYTDTLFATANIFTIWEIDLPPTWDGTPLPHVFGSTMDLKTGASIGRSSTHPPVVTSGTVTVTEASSNLTLAPFFWDRHDYNQNGDFPYDYALGGFAIRNIGNTQADNLEYKWELPEELAIRAITFPGRAGDDISDIVATVKNAGGSTRTVTVAGPIIATDATAAGTVVGPNQLGLAADEYILELTAKQTSLSAADYAPDPPASPITYNTNSSGIIYGRYQNGATREVKLSITSGGTTLSAQLTPNDVWDVAGGGNVTNTFTKEGGGTGSWYPGEQINIVSQYTAINNLNNLNPISHSNEVVDPIVSISLPTGVVLDMASVRGYSPAGNHGTSEFAVDFLSAETKVIAGIEWTTYRFVSKEHQDMIAQPTNYGAPNTVTGGNAIQLRYSVNIDMACQAYGQLNSYDFSLWDIGQTAQGGGSTPDVNDKLKKGTTYRGVRASISAGQWAVIQKSGLTVGLGIRTQASGDDFITYDGTEATIISVTPNKGAEIRLWVKNTSDSAFHIGSEIYLPIPKKDLGYQDYFNNAAKDPYNTTDNRQPEFTLELTEEIILPYFNTLYSVDTSTAVNSGTVTETWVPVSHSFVDYTTLTTVLGKTLADVTMVKFVAHTQIGTGVETETIIKADVDDAAKIEQQNFWRSYQKGWSQPTGEGTWYFGSALAAEPAAGTVEGILFKESGTPDGIKQAAESYDNTAGKIIATLTEKNMKINPIFAVMNADGSFVFKNDIGEIVTLKAGEYTVTIDNADDNIGFTPVTSATKSNGTDWYMNIDQGNVAASMTRGTYTFVIAASLPDTALANYVGVGFIEKPIVTFKAGTGTTFADSSRAIFHGSLLTGAPNIGAAQVLTGYDINTQMWTIDKDVTLQNGTTITAGTPITRTQLYQIKVTENIVATASLTPFIYNITYVLDGGLNNASNPNTYDYGVGVPSFEPATKAGYSFTGWFDAATGGNQITAIGTTEMGDKTLYARYEIASNTVKYTITNPEVGGGSAPAETNYAFGAEVTVAGAPTPPPAGYDFSGWATESGVTITAGKFDMPNANVEFKGTWVPLTTTAYHVEHYKQNLDGTTYTIDGSAEDFAGTTDAVALASSYAPKSFEGFSHEKTTWTTSTDGESTTERVIKGDGSLVIKVYYTRASYSVSYAYTGTVPTGAPSVPTTHSQDFGSAVALTPPTFAGYEFVGWTSADVTVASNAFTMPAKNVALTGSWTAKTDTAYRVEHYQKDVGTTNYTFVEAENDAGVTGAQASFTPNSYQGFEFEPSKTTPAVTTITADGSLVIKLYYTREVYDVTYSYTNTVPGASTLPTGATGVEFGATVTVAAEASADGYTFSGWAIEGTAAGSSFTMPASNVEITGGFTAKGDTPYKVEYWTQDLTGGDYSKAGEDGFTGETATVAAYTAVPQEGFTYEKVTYLTSTDAESETERVIKGDGSLVIKVFYTRASYEVSYAYTGTVPTGAPSVPTTHSEKFEATVNATAPSLAGYTFVGWTSADVTVTSNAFTMPAKNVALTGSWTANSGIPYEVEHYKQDVGAATYTLAKTDDLTGTAGEEAAYTQENYPGFTYDSTQTTPSLTPTVAGDGSLVIKLYYTRNTDTPYKVEHHQKDVGAATYTLVTTENLTGETGASATYASKTYTGFTYDATQTTPSLTPVIEGDGSLVIKLYYTRDVYNLSYAYTNTVPEASTLPAGETGIEFGATVTVAADATAPGYTFSGWAIEGTLAGASFTMPANDVELKGGFTANGDTKYKIEYYTEKLDGTYELAGDDEFTGETETVVSYSAPAQEGFTYDASQDEWNYGATEPVIKGDGSLVIKLYYTRASFEVTYEFTGKVPSKASELPADASAKYEEEVTLAQAATAPGYDFTGWVSEDATIANDAFDMPAKNVKITGSFKARDDVAYTIVHNLKDLQSVSPDTYTVADTEHKTGTADEIAQYADKTYAGFTFDESKTTWNNGGEEPIVAGDGSLVIELFYTRNTYKVTYKFEGIVPAGVTPPAEATYEHGERVTVEIMAAVNGYRFTGFTTEDATIADGVFEMPQKDVVLVGTWSKDNNSVAAKTPGGGLLGRNNALGKGAKTGDTTNILVYGSVLALAAIFASVLLVTKKKRNLNRKSNK